MAWGSKQSRGIRQNVRFRPMATNTVGMVANRAERFMPISAAINIENMHAVAEGSWSAHQVGYENMNGTVYESGAAFQGLFWYVKPNGDEALVGAINGKLVSIDIGTYTATVIDSSTGFLTTTLVDGQVYDGYLYTCDGEAAEPRRWDGTTAQDSAGWPAYGFSAPSFVEQHNGRLAYGVNDPVNGAHVVLSTIQDGEDFPASPADAGDGIAINVGVGDGQLITGIRSVFIPQTNDTFLAVAKERSLYIITGYSALAADSDYFAVIRANGNFGCVNNQSMVQIGNDLLMIGELPGGGYGIISYTTSLQSGTMQPSLMGSSYIKPVLESINRTAVAKCYAVHLPNRREVVFGIPTGSSSTVNKWIVYKYPTSQEESAKWSVRTLITHSAGVVYQDKVFFGTTEGYLSKWFESSTYNGTAIPWSYEMPFTDLGIEGQYKRVPTAWAHFKSSIATTVNIQATWQGGGNNNNKTASLPLGSNVSQSVYGVAVYGTGTYAGQVEVKRQFKIRGNGERLKLEISGSTGDNGGPEFLGITTQIEYGGPSHHYN